MIKVPQPSQALTAMGYDVALWQEQLNVILKAVTGLREVTADVTIDYTDFLVVGDATGGNITVTLPTSGADGKVFIFAKTNATAPDVIVARKGTDTIDGATSFTITSQYESYTIAAITGGWVSI